MGNYSCGAALVVAPYVIGTAAPVGMQATEWRNIAAHTRLIVSFGGMAPKNLQISFGGTGPHRARGWMARLGAAGIETVSISPLRDDTVAELGARWLPIRPNADTALMLGLAHTLLAEDLHDRAFLERYCAGFGRFAAYLDGTADGTVKDAEWAAARCDIAAEEIRALARRMAATRTMITLSYSLQRADRGEQPIWAGIALACDAGPDRPAGRRVRHRLRRDGVDREREDRRRAARAACRQGPDGELHPGRPHLRNAAEPRRRSTTSTASGAATPTSAWSGGPAATRSTTTRTSTGCSAPGASRRRSSCRTRSGRRRRAMPTSCCRRRPRWSATISAPAAAIPRSTPCSKAVEPVGEARSDYDIVAGLAGRMGLADAFTGGKDELGWIRESYDAFAGRMAQGGRGACRRSRISGATAACGCRSRRTTSCCSPISAPIPRRTRSNTPSGKIELYSATVANYGYDDCPGHPVWIEPREWLGAPLAARFPLHLVSNQPATRLHSQLDPSPVSSGGQGGGARGGDHPPRRRARPRHRRRRHGQALQRPRPVPRRRAG